MQQWGSATVVAAMAAASFDPLAQRRANHPRAVLMHIASIVGICTISSCGSLLALSFSCIPPPSREVFVPAHILGWASPKNHCRVSRVSFCGCALGPDLRIVNPHEDPPDRPGIYSDIITGPRAGNDIFPNHDRLLSLQVCGAGFTIETGRALLAVEGHGICGESTVASRCSDLLMLHGSRRTS